MRPSGSNGDRPREPMPSQDIRVGRHKDKLELIRDSLRPFQEQRASEHEHKPLDPRQLMLHKLLVKGYEKETAIHALRSVNYQSAEAAQQYISNLHRDHTDYRVNGNGLNGLNGNHLPSPPSFQQATAAAAAAAAVNGTKLTLTQSLPHTSHHQPLHLTTSHPSTSQFEVDSERQSPSYRYDYDNSQSASPRGYPKLPYTDNHNDVYRSHANIQIRAPAAPRYDDSLYPGRREGHGNTSVITIDRTDSARAGLPSNVPLSRAPPLTVIRTRFERPVASSKNNARLQINVAPGDHDRRQQFRLEVQGSEPGASITVAGNPNGAQGVQSIIVDPDGAGGNTQPPPARTAYINYKDKMVPLGFERQYAMRSEGRGDGGGVSRMPHVEDEEPLDHRLDDTVGRMVDSLVAGERAHKHLEKPGASERREERRRREDSVQRCASPLPDSVAQLIDDGRYEAFAKPCKPRMFCFYMEQHVEQVIQQYKERQKRAQQLRKEMEAANLSSMMKDQMMKFLAVKESKYMRLKRQKMNRDMFDMIKHIGVGAFGQVTLVKKKDSGQVYAMKTLLKKDVIMKQQAAHVKAERDILAEANSSWIVKLFFSFQDDRTLYFIMEYVPGGDMMQLLIVKGVFSEKLARFYIAELTCAIEYVHSLGFIHRDIKPDNILIDQQGHIKLTDFGLCTGLRWTHDRRYYGPENDDDPQHSHQRVDSFALPPDVAHLESCVKVLDVRHQKKRNQAHSVVGTGNYMAPEVILKTGHTQLCDWWSVGVILYEMVFGRPPFMSVRDDPYETQHKIVSWPRYLDVSPRAGGAHLSADCIRLITSLCCDEAHRVGRVDGARDVKRERWFRGIDFATLRQQKAEYIPRVEHAEDTSNFDTMEVTETPFETLTKRGAHSNPAFYEFTFRHFFDYDGQGCPSLRPKRPKDRPNLAPLLESSQQLIHQEEEGEEMV